MCDDDWFTCVMWLVRVCDVTYSDGWHDSIMYVWHDSFKRVTWLIRVCDVTYSYMWHDSIMHVAWHVLIRMCDGYDWVMSHIRMRTSGSFVCLTCVWLVLLIMCDSYDWVMAHIRTYRTYEWEHVLISMCDQHVTRSHSYVWLTWLGHGTHTHKNELSFACVIRVWVVLIRVCDSYAWVISHIRMRTSSHSYVRMRTSSHSYVRMRTSFHSYVWLLSDLFLIVCVYVTHTIESCPTNEWERVTRSDSWRGSFKHSWYDECICASWLLSAQWLIHMCSMPRSCSLLCVQWLIPIHRMPHSHISPFSMQWNIPMRSMPHSHMIESCHTNEWERVTRSHSCRHSLIRVTWRMHMCVVSPCEQRSDPLFSMLHSHVRTESLTRATWLIDVCDITSILQGQIVFGLFFGVIFGFFGTIWIVTCPKIAGLYGTWH